MRKFYFIVLALTALASSAQTTAIVDGIKYILDGSSATVTYPNANAPGTSEYTGNIVIPAQVIYEGVTYDVTGIADYAFRYATISSITLPEGLLSIGKEAIYKTDITEIVVPNSVVTLGESCISENANLQTLTFGSHIADKKWGVWVAWRVTGGYEVYMYCDKMPELGDNQTFDDSHESNIHIYPSLYLQYKNNYYWACHHIVADLEEKITADELKGYVADYSALLPASEEVGMDPGFYTPASVKALTDALTYASSLGEDATYLRTEHTSSYVDGLEKEPDLYKQALQYIFDCVKADKPVIFHCHIGADRTGTLAFLLEGLLGVSMSDIYKDYELTSFSYFDNVRYKENIDGLFNLILSKKGDTLTDKFYTYINGELGLGEQDIADFRAKMLGIDIPDVIAPVEIAPMEDSAIYNLAGQRLKELQKGINIHNGKKFYLK